MFVSVMCHHSTIQYIVVVVVRQSQDRATLMHRAVWHDKSGMLGRCECQRCTTMKEFGNVYAQKMSHLVMN